MPKLPIWLWSVGECHYTWLEVILFFTRWDGLKKITKLNFEIGSRKIVSLIHSLWKPQIDTVLVFFFFLSFWSTFWQNTNLKITSTLTQKSHFKEVFLYVYQFAPRQMPDAANYSRLQAKMHYQAIVKSECAHPLSGAHWGSQGYISTSY